MGGVLDKEPGAHQAVVLLSLTNQGGLCTGSLIAPNLVLTAWHCVAINLTEGIGCDIDGNSTNGDHVSGDHDPASIQVFTGTNPHFWSGQGVAKGKKIFHPEGFNLCNKDIALILLDKAVNVAPPMKLRLDFSAQIGELTTVVGYGKTSNNDWNSGVRYRRENIPVISVGRDINEYLGENEFIMGQSTCQGDSGGPVMAGDTKAILGVTSRGGDCDTGKQRFTRVDAHRKLIEAALAEAGASAQLEGKALPPPPEVKATGDGPCTTGAQCSGYYCHQGMCSALCSAGFCPSGTFCLPATVTIADQKTPDVPVCQEYTPINACDNCRHNKCKTKAETCRLDKSCAAMFACVSKCSTPACYDSCAAKNAKGAGLYEDLHDCECSSKCAKDCSGLCGEKPSGMGGSGGSGGSSSGTGGSSAGASGSDTGSGGSGEGGSEGGEGGSAEPGVAGSAGVAGSMDPGTAGSSGMAPAGAGGQPGGSGATASPAAQPTDGENSGDHGGCSAARSPVPGDAWVWGMAALVGLCRRPRRSF
ncbi:MAG: trypsin-like serine protease [Myxococcales bacterium]|nr:trypsin-like serine protease [Polyangiaceae bacterium]MDW8248980.1 trypsin-like serine protease [Myxococcales bacterium]